LAGPANQRTLGPEDESKQITVTVWLNLHNKAAQDARVQDMYDKSSPNYHHFLIREEYQAEFAPSVFNPPTAPVTFESASDLAQPLQNTKFFVSALFQSASSTRWDVFTFGTDSSLTTGPGWDNVTGLGTPQGSPFIEAVVNALK
jgi:Pro-kumamolisin, activation domain